MDGFRSKKISNHSITHPVKVADAISELRVNTIAQIRHYWVSAGAVRFGRHDFFASHYWELLALVPVLGSGAAGRIAGGTRAREQTT